MRFTAMAVSSGDGIADLMAIHEPRAYHNEAVPDLLIMIALGLFIRRLMLKFTRIN
jgi:hypothetical protein